MLYILIGLMAATIFMWLEGLSWVADRTLLGENSMNLMVWSLFETIPNLVFLAVFYIYMFDIVEYYTADVNLGGGVFTTVIFTYYTNVVSYWLTKQIRDFDTYMVQFYLWTYDFIEFFLWPETWVDYVGDLCNIIAEELRTTFKLKAWTDLLKPTS